MTDDDRSSRQIARGQRRSAGDRSARLANALMTMSGPALARLDLDDELREVIERARAVTSHNARRRAERALAGELRRYDLHEIADELDKAGEASGAATSQLHAAERWRARLIDEGLAAADAFPGGPDPAMPELIAAAQRERATGRPRGAARALFRHIVQRLKA